MKSPAFEKIMKTVKRDPLNKLLALALATLAFLTIQKTINDTREFSVPIKPQLQDNTNLAILSYEPQEVKVTLSGSSEQLNAIDKTELRWPVTIKVSAESGREKAEERIKLPDKTLEGHGRARVKKVERDEVVVVVDREGRVDFPLTKTEIIGTPLMGEANIAAWSNTMVSVKGPKAQLEMLRGQGMQLATEKLDVDGRVQSFSRRVKIIPPKGINIASMSPEEINVSVVIASDSIRKSFTNMPVVLTSVSGVDLSLISKPSRVEVSITGARESVENLAQESILVIADCRDILEKGSRAEYKLRVFPPPGMESLAAEARPNHVMVSVKPPEPAPSDKPEAPPQDTAAAPETATKAETGGQD